MNERPNEKGFLTPVSDPLGRGSDRWETAGQRGQTGSGTVRPPHQSVVTPVGGDGLKVPDPLPEWLQSCRSRDVALGLVDGDQIVATGPATDADAAMVQRHAHALAIAAAGTHPTWWLHVLRRGPAPRLDELPVTVDPDTIDGLAFRCSTCGHPADFLEPDLLAWCEAHR